MMQANKKTAITAGTVTADKKCENDTTHDSRFDYSTFKEKMQEVIAKFVCAGSFWLMYGMVMYALCYTCYVKG